MVAGRWDQKIVFSDNAEFDQLRRKAGQDGRVTEITGQIADFDGPYPVLSVGKFRLQELVEPRKKKRSRTP